MLTDEQIKALLADWEGWPEDNAAPLDMREARELCTRVLASEARIKVLEDALANAEKLARTVAENSADAALTGLPEQTRTREGMEAAATKIADQIMFLRKALEAGK